MQKIQSVWLIYKITTIDVIHDKKFREASLFFNGLHQIFSLNLGTKLIYILIITYKQMGSSLNNDKDIQIYLTLNNSMFYAGEHVEGVVHINCLTNRPYQYLNLTIDGSQFCNLQHLGSLQQSSGMPVLTLKFGQRQTYHVELNLAHFPHGMPVGNYNFPFSILLPQSMPASLNLSKQNYIKYQIAAVIPSHCPQIYKRQLHIRQPPRGKITELKKAETKLSACCGCCCYCGRVNLTLQTQTTTIQNGQPFWVGGSIDNTEGQIAITNYKIVLREKVRKESTRSGKKREDYTDFVILDAGKSVAEGNFELIQTMITLPTDFKGYTAVGNIISRYYYLCLVLQSCCCISNPTVAVPRIVLSNIPPLERFQDRVTLPLNWNPIIARPLAFINIVPYKYSPCPSINPTNQENKVPFREQMQEGPPSELMLYK